MKLVYRRLPGPPTGRPAVVLHDRGAGTVERVAALAMTSGAVGPMVAPFGDYGFTSSGMELAGICWYRTVPGPGGIDPVSLAKAVLQVADLVDEVGLVSPVLIGSGQGAVAGLGAGLLRSDRVGAVVCVDAEADHLEALPAGALGALRPPPVLLVGRDGDGDGDKSGGVGRSRAVLDGHGIAAEVRGYAPGDGAEQHDQVVAEAIGRWLDDG